MRSVLKRVVVSLPLLALAILPSFAQLPPPASGDRRTKAVMLGVGSPVIDSDRSGTSIGIVAGETLYVFDAGPGVERRILEAKSQLSALAVERFGPVFITHLHLDHTLGLAALYRYHQFSRGAVLAMGQAPLTVYGPPGITQMMENIATAFAPLNAGVRTSLKVATHELKASEVAYKDDNIIVRVFAVSHKDGPAFGYRIETADRVIVISGDTRPVDAVVDACDGCDVLFHEVFGLAFGPEGPRVGTPSEGHTSAAELGSLASRARPKLLVLYHTLGASRDDLLAQIKKSFTGSVSYARDLEVF